MVPKLWMRGLGIKGPGKAGAGAEAWKAGRAETERWTPDGWKAGRAETEGWTPDGWKRGSVEPVAT